MKAYSWAAHGTMKLRHNIDQILLGKRTTNMVRMRTTREVTMQQEIEFEIDDDLFMELNNGEDVEDVIGTADGDNAIESYYKNHVREKDVDVVTEHIEHENNMFSFMVAD